MAGYIDHSESVNSSNAKKEGRMPASHIAKLLKVSTKFIKETFDPCEWHHTSKFYNKTEFYDLEEVKAYLLENPNAYKDFKTLQKRLKENPNFWIDFYFDKIKALKYVYFTRDSFGNKKPQKPKKLTLKSLLGKSKYSLEYAGEKHALTYFERNVPLDFVLPVGFFTSKEEANKAYETNLKYYEEEQDKVRKRKKREILKKKIHELATTPCEELEYGKAWAVFTSTGRVKKLIPMHDSGYKLTFQEYRLQSKKELSKFGSVYSIEVHKKRAYVPDNFLSQAKREKLKELRQKLESI